MITVACVLKTGVFKNRNMSIVYKPEHVQWLAKQVKRHLGFKHRFICLSDVIVPGVQTIKLENDWPGWWSKIELFNPENGLENCLYLDLDTVIVGCLKDICRATLSPGRPGFSILRNISHGAGVGSGMMAWKNCPFFLYNVFKQNPEKFMHDYTVPRRWGDQGFIQDRMAIISEVCGQTQFFQDACPPGQLVSWKHDMRPEARPDKDARVVIFNGLPKPWDLKNDWIPPCP